MTPLSQINHLSHTGALLPAGRTAAFSSSRAVVHSFRARSGIRAALSFFIDAFDHKACKLSNRTRRHVLNPFVKVVPDAWERRAEGFADVRTIFGETRNVFGG